MKIIFFLIAITFLSGCDTFDLMEELKNVLDEGIAGPTTEQTTE